MKAVIITAGKGTRMGPLTENRPKVMLPIINKPLLEHIILELKIAGIKDLCMVVGYHKEKIIEYFGNGSNFGVNIEYIEQKVQNGTAGAIVTARNSIDARFLVINGDTLIDGKDIERLCNTKGDAVLAAKKVGSPEQYGILYVKGEKIDRIVEKPKEFTSDLANVGVYIFDRSIFDIIDNTGLSKRGEYEITDSIQSMIDSGNELRYITIGRWQDIGFPWHMLEANEIMLRDKKKWEILGNVEPYATLQGDIAIGKGTIIRNGVYITGPVVIGDNCDIGPNCYIRSATSIGNNVRIGNAVEIKNSIVMNGTHIGHLSYVGDSIIGENCNFGAGTKVANLRHDDRTIIVDIAGRKFDSGRRKLGVIMGDNVHTGINSGINVGTIVASGTCTNPGEIVMTKK
jgi:bifunctional UDP-N-acetylglucosamine pyrophosphorylase/glucosamine-1-phosphate N-acetyltransferase